MNLLRSLKKNDTSPVFGNFRPVQPLNDRTVRASFQVSELNATTSPTATTAADTTTPTTTAVVTTNITTPVEANVTSTYTTTTTTTATRATESPTVAIDFDAGSATISMTAGLFLSMLFAALFLH